MFLMKRNDPVNVSLPKVVEATGKYDGNDGRWSTFFINAGDDGQNSRGQNFRLLVSTSSPLTMPPAAASECDEECAPGRGVEVFENNQPRGFEDDLQRGWEPKGLFELPLPYWWPEEFPRLRAHYGTWTVGLGLASRESLILAGQPIALTPDNDYYYLGSFGLGIMTVESDTARTTFLYNFKDSGRMIETLSYGYGAGAVYRNNNGVLGSLVLGGYDESRMVNKGVSINMPDENNASLIVAVSSITYQPKDAIDDNIHSITTNETWTFSAAIDSSTPYMILPEPICNEFATVYRLTYDEERNMYFANESTRNFNHQQEADLNIKVDGQGGDSVTIQLPYDAFDLEISRTDLNGTRRYFPLKRSTNGVNVLGRSFLQEAYLVVDYERRNFTVAPARYTDPMPPPALRPIFNSSFSNSSLEDSSGGGGISSGAIAGIVVGIVVAFLVAGIGFFFWWKKRRNAKKAELYSEKPSEIDTMHAGNEVKHRRVSELDSNPPGSPKSTLVGYYDRDQKDGTLPFPPISEMDSPPAELYSPPPETPALSSVTPSERSGGIDYFVAGHKVRRRGATRESSTNNTPGTPAAAPLAELPGDDGQFQVGGQHFEPVKSPSTTPDLERAIPAKGPSDASIAGVMGAADEKEKEKERKEVKQEKEKKKASEEKAEGEDTIASLERRPSHTRGLSDTSDVTAVSQPTAEELEQWATSNRSPRPISEQDPLP